MLGRCTVADEWISLAQAFKMMLASEGDPVLVERLLMPALWHGDVPAISRRALVEGRRVKDLKLVTNNEWRWEESPIIFDFKNSRAWSPSGFNRPTRDSESTRIDRIEYYGIEVSKEALLAFLPDLRGRTGELARKSPGRPNVVQIFGPEIDRRSQAGERYATQTAWAKALIDWYRQVYGKEAPPISPKSVTNHYGRRLSQLRPNKGSVECPKPKTK